jgi:hypothetical protein
MTPSGQTPPSLPNAASAADGRKSVDCGGPTVKLHLVIPWGYLNHESSGLYN